MRTPQAKYQGIMSKADFDRVAMQTDFMQHKIDRARRVLVDAQSVADVAKSENVGKERIYKNVKSFLLKASKL